MEMTRWRHILVMFFESVTQYSLSFTDVFVSTRVALQAVHNHWSFFHILDSVFEREHRSNCHWCLKCYVKLNLLVVSFHQLFQPKSVILALPTYVWELEKSLRICISTYTPLCACLAVKLISAFMIHSHWLEVFWNNFSNLWFILI